MPNKGQTGINDATLWRQEWMRQFFAVKTALHSLRLQTEQRREGKATSKAVKEMAFYFELVNEAFAVLNRDEPQPTSEDFIPGPGRREFLSDLKHGEVRT